MKLEVGKTYVLSDGRKARCICVDRKRQGGLSAMLLYTAPSDNNEYTYYCTVDGSPFNGGTLRVLKEYVPKIKVRVIVFQRADGSVRSSSIAEGDNAFTHPARGGWLGPLTHITILSDSIVEVEQN